MGHLAPESPGVQGSKSTVPFGTVVLFRAGSTVPNGTVEPPFLPLPFVLLTYAPGCWGGYLWYEFVQGKGTPVPEHIVEALIMRVTPQANITDGTGTTIPAATAAQALKVLARTARLQGGTITVTQHGYDPADPTNGPTLAVHPTGRVEESEGTGPGPRWVVGYHSWVIEVEHEGSYNVPGVPTALGDAQMLATRLNCPVAVHVEDIKPDTTPDSYTLIHPAEPAQTGTQPVDETAVPGQEDPAEVPVPDEVPAELGDGEPAGTVGEGDALDEPGHHPSTETHPGSVVMAPEQLDDVAGASPAEPDPHSGQDPPHGPAAALSGEDPEPLPVAPLRRRRPVMLAVLVALVLLTGGTTAAVGTVLGSLSPEPSPTVSGPAPVLWHTATVPGEATAAHGVLANTSPGKAEFFSLKDGKPLGGGALPEGRPRVFTGAKAVFAAVTGPDGTATGYAATPAGVKDFTGIKGTLVTRGTEPFFLTGTGKDQAAMVWDGTGWKTVPAPEPGMAPVGASTAGVLWLGINNRLVNGTTTSTLAAPDGGTKISNWVAADETSVVLVWERPNGKVLAVHSLTDGTITGQLPVPDTDIRKDGELIRAGAQTFTINSGAPVPARCADPVPAGGRQWCKTDKTWAADNTRPLASGQTPVPSPAEVVITATNEGFTAYTGDAMNTEHNN